MRVMLSAYSCEPNAGSEPGFGWHWTKHLAAAGHQVTVLTRSEGRSAIEASDEISGKPFDAVQFRFIDTPGWTRRIPGDLASLLRYFAWQRAALKSAAELARASEFDVVHHVTWGNLTVASYLWRLGLPFVLGPIGGAQVAPKAFKHYFDRGWVTERARTLAVRGVRFDPLTRGALSHARLVLATNRETERLARKLGARSVALFLDSGVEQGSIRSEPFQWTDSESLRVLWVGRLMPRKSVHLAVAAVARAAERIPLTLTIAGDGPLRDELEERIEQYGVRRIVRSLGHVPWEGMNELYRSHDVLLFSSLRDSFGSQLLEAMAQATPIICLDHQGASDFVPDDAGIKVPLAEPDTVVEGLANALVDIAGDSSARIAMGSRAWETAQLHTWERKAAAMTNLYETAVLER